MSVTKAAERRFPSTRDGECRMNRKNLVTYMATKYNISEDDAQSAYRMTMDAIRDLVAGGVKLSLSGFGVFYLQTHRGHPVRFQAAGDRTESYLVFKFSASNTLNKFVRDKHGALEN